MSIVNTGNIFIFFGLVLIGALLPDIDSPESKVGRHFKFIGRIFKHRGVFHSIITAVIIGVLVWYFISQPYATAIFMGYASHLFMDGFTKQGINFLHPVTKLHLSGFIETGKTGEWLVFGLIIAGILYKFGVFGMIL